MVVNKICMFGPENQIPWQGPTKFYMPAMILAVMSFSPGRDRDF